jgi:hypothetical protein
LPPYVTCCKIPLMQWTILCCNYDILPRRLCCCISITSIATIYDMLQNNFIAIDYTMLQLLYVTSKTSSLHYHRIYCHHIYSLQYLFLQPHIGCTRFFCSLQYLFLQPRICCTRFFVVAIFVLATTYWLH